MSFYQMHRGWMDNRVFGKEPFTRAQAWCWLIENAAWKETSVKVEGGMLTLQRGQLAVSLRYLAKAWRWQTDKRVRGFLSRLQSDDMVRIEHRKRVDAPLDAHLDAPLDAGRNLITICKYEDYQAPTKSMDAPLDAPLDAGMDANKKKIKEVNNNSRRDGRTVKAVVFSEGKAWLAEKTGKAPESFGSLIGKWCRDNGDEGVLLALVAAQKEDPADPVPWIVARLGGKAGGSGFKPAPAWADKYRNDGSPKGRRYDPDEDEIYRGVEY